MLANEFRDAIDAAHRFINANPTGMETENLKTLVEQCEKEIAGEAEI